MCLITSSPVSPIPHATNPTTTPSYQEMAAHFGTVVTSARKKKPRDKAKVEVGVKVIERWILAALRKDLL